MTIGDAMRWLVATVIVMVSRFMPGCPVCANPGRARRTLATGKFSLVGAKILIGIVR